MPDDDIELGPDDRDTALERGFTQHDTLSFRGKPLLPLTIATHSVLQRAGNRLVTGASEAPFADAAGFILIHSADPDENRKARSFVWKGKEVWNEYVYQYLSDNPDIHSDLMDAIPMFRKMIEDFGRTLTKSASAVDGKKKYGPPAGSRGSSRSWRRKRDGVIRP